MPAETGERPGTGAKVYRRSSNDSAVEAKTMIDAAGRRNDTESTLAVAGAFGRGLLAVTTDCIGWKTGGFPSGRSGWKTCTGLLPFCLSGG